jgi:hypothetical protein
VNVGNGIAVGELQRGVLFEKRNHLWAGLRKASIIAGSKCSPNSCFK